MVELQAGPERIVEAEILGQPQAGVDGDRALRLSLRGKSPP
jgi:hypothetical protein